MGAYTETMSLLSRDSQATVLRTAAGSLSLPYLLGSQSASTGLAQLQQQGQRCWSWRPWPAELALRPQTWCPELNMINFRCGCDETAISSRSGDFNTIQSIRTAFWHWLRGRDSSLHACRSRCRHGGCGSNMRLDYLCSTAVDTGCRRP